MKRFKAIGAALLACAVLITTGCSKSHVDMDALKGISSIAPVMVQYNRQFSAGGGGLNALTMSLFDINKRLTDEEKVFYDDFTDTFLELFESYSDVDMLGREALISNQVYLTKTVDPVEAAKEGSSIFAKKENWYYVPSPFRHIGHKDTAALGEVAKGLGVDAVAVFRFKYFTYKVGSFVMAKYKYQLKCYVDIIDKDGNKVADFLIKSGRLVGREGVDIGGFSISEQSDGFYEELRDSFLRNFEQLVKETN